MKTRNLLWAGLIGLIVVLFGCKKDKDLFAPNVDRAKVEIEERDDSFFSFDFAKEVFDLNYENTISEKYLERVRQRLAGSALQTEIVNDLGVPCWSCTETEMNFASRTSLHYTPILANGNNSIEVEGILIGETYGPVTDLYIIDKTYFSFEEGDKTYFAGIFQFFRESVNGATPDKELYFRSRKCTPATDNSDPEPQYIGPCECPASWECAIQEYSSDCFNAECVPGNPNNGGGGDDNGGSGGDDNDDGTNGNDNNGSTFNIFDIFGNWFFGSKWFLNFWGGGGAPSGGGGSWSSSDPLLPNGFFNQFAFDDPLEWEVARQVNNFRAKYNLYHVNSAQLLQLLNDCGYSDYTSILNLVGAGDGSGFPDCIKSILENAALFILENADGLVLDSDELIDIFEHYVYTTDFPSWRKTLLIQYLKDLVGFSSGAETWLTSYERPMSFTVEFYEFLREEEFSVQSLNFVKDLLNWVAVSGVDLTNAEVLWLLKSPPEEFNLLSDFLASYTGDPILIEGTWYVLDNIGLLHVYIPPIDMNNATDLEIFEQMLLVLEKIHLYFCEGHPYEPIDWEDYFDNYHSAFGEVNWNGCQAIFDLTSLLQPHSIMETDPSWNHDTGSGWTYKWVGYNTNFPMLQITIDYGCTESFESKIFPSCE